MDWSAAVQGSLVVIGFILGFVFFAIGVSTSFVFGRIGLEAVQKQWSASRDADRMLEEAVQDAKKDWDSRH